MNDIETTKKVLERIYEKYNDPRFIPPDPLQFLYRFAGKENREIAGFLSAGLAYGNVKQIERSLEKLFAITGDDIFNFTGLPYREKQAALRGFKHRFNTGRDIAELLEIFRIVYEDHGGLEEYFAGFCDRRDENLMPALERFTAELAVIYRKRFRKAPGEGLRYLLVSPEKGSTCKRMNLFLRWMIRRDRVDPGPWEKVSPAGLVVPVDVHMARLTRFLGFHNKKNINLRTAVEITGRFAEICPEDPVKYDFALCRIGILENCNGLFHSRCGNCGLRCFCEPRFARAGRKIETVGKKKGIAVKGAFNR